MVQNLFFGRLLSSFVVVVVVCKCSGPQLCLNEYHLVMVLFGAFVGYSHSLFGVVHNMNYVPFHAVQVCSNFFLVNETCRANTGSGVCLLLIVVTFALFPTLAIQVSSFQGNSPCGGEMQRHSSPLFHQELPWGLLLFG